MSSTASTTTGLLVNVSLSLTLVLTPCRQVYPFDGYNATLRTARADAYRVLLQYVPVFTPVEDVEGKMFK